MDAAGHVAGLGGERVERQRDLGAVEPALHRLGKEATRSDLLADLLFREHALDLGPGAVVEHVAGEEGLHLGRDPLDRVVAPLIPERGRDVLGDPGKAVPAQLERLQELVLRVGELVGHVEPLDPLQEALSGAAIGCDLGFDLELRQPPRRVLEAAEELLGELIRLVHDPVEVGDVVLEAALLARVEAASDAQQEQDQDDAPTPRAITLRMSTWRWRTDGPRLAPGPLAAGSSSSSSRYDTLKPGTPSAARV